MLLETTHARHDPLHCLTPGLFRSLKKGDRKRQKLDITYVFGQDSVRFWGPEPLGVDDMRVLQGLVAMAAISGENGRGILLSPHPGTEDGQQLRLMLQPKFDSADKDALVVKGSYRQLAKEIGYRDYESGTSLRAIRSCIERLWAVSVIIERAGKRKGFRILSEYASDDKAGRLFVALNPNLADAIIGNSQHYRIDMHEVRSLQLDAARLIHQRLHWINSGKTGKVSMLTLCSYVWPDESSNENTCKARRKTVRQAMANMTELQWQFAEYAPGKFEVARPQVAAPD